MKTSKDGDSFGAEAHVSRRQFVGSAVAMGLGGATWLQSPRDAARGEELKASSREPADIRFGLVTYQWGKDWDLPTLIGHCTAAKAFGVELRTTHRHGVEPSLTPQQRLEVRQQFADSPVKCLGIGSDERFDNPDPAIVKQALEATRAFVRLSHDIGGSGVKVKPDSFHKNVPHERTIEQIGRALNEAGEFAEGFGQQIRLEVHGQCCQLPTIAAILAVANHKNVAVCWNSNPQDLEDPGLEHNFHLVQDRLGATTHVHRLESASYPHQQLLDLFVRHGYSGWWLLEEGTVPKDPAAELGKQRQRFEAMLAESRARIG